MIWVEYKSLDLSIALKPENVPRLLNYDIK